MKKISLAPLLLPMLLMAVLTVPVVAETVIYDQTFTWSDADVFESHTGGYGNEYYYHQSQIYITPLLSALEPTQLMAQAPNSELKIFGSHPNGGWPVTFTSNGVVIGSGEYYYFQYSVGNTLYTQSVVDFVDVDWSGVVSGKIAMSAPPTGYNYAMYNHAGYGTESVPYQLTSADTPGYAACFWDGAHHKVDGDISFYTAVSYDWANQVRITDTGGSENPLTRLDLIRDAVPGDTRYSSLYITDAKNFNYTSVNSDADVLFTFLADHYPLDLRLNTHLNKWFNMTITFSSTSEPDGPVAPVTVYVQNSQTGAAIANSRIVIDALVDGDYYPVVNRTEPSGVFSVTLQPTGGGMPNPDSYRLIASADGYINQMPEINFTVDEYITSIYCSLDPIAGGPVDENKTFIDFFVRDMSANPITGATINFGGYTMITNSAGYAVLEVSKNITYTYTVSKSGYGSLTGNAVIGADPRHNINTVLAPAITPTKTTPIPTSTSISPTPTMTAPTGEPVSNWLDWFAAHFGMILGGGVEIGKIFMWLCFSVPVGVYVAKEAKAGAAGFMAGAGIVTLFFVLIGWVPIWLLVLLALIIGLLYAKVFNNSDTGGGR